MDHSQEPALFVARECLPIAVLFLQVGDLLTQPILLESMIALQAVVFGACRPQQSLQSLCLELEALCCLTVGGIF